MMQGRGTVGEETDGYLIKPASACLPWSCVMMPVALSHVLDTACHGHIAKDLTLPIDKAVAHREEGHTLRRRRFTPYPGPLL